MTGRVDDVDLHPVVANAGGLRQDRDTPLALQIVGIHDTLDNLFVGSKNTALPQHGIDEGRLSVVDVRDDCYISNRVTGHKESS